MKRARRTTTAFIISFLIFSLAGCDAFVRKFTRKTKRDNLPQEEMVLAPEEYKPTMTKGELYHQYLLFWKSWQDELIEALLRNMSHKKQLDCAQQALKNLVQLRTLLNAEKQKKLDIYIKRMQDLRDAIVEDVYGSDSRLNRSAAERLRIFILHEFSYDNIKDSIT